MAVLAKSLNTSTDAILLISMVLSKLVAGPILLKSYCWISKAKGCSPMSGIPSNTTKGCEEYTSFLDKSGMGAPLKNIFCMLPGSPDGS
ncbi:hypothetical protein D3C85_794820 [compost metagenome]